MRKPAQAVVSSMSKPVPYPNLLQMYQAAIAELRATGDQKVMGLIHRFEQRHAEAIATIAEKNADAIAAVRASAFS